MALRKLRVLRNAERLSDLTPFRGNPLETRKGGEGGEGDIVEFSD